MKTTFLFLSVYLFLSGIIQPFISQAQNTFQKEYSPGSAAPFIIDTLPDGYLVAGSVATPAAGGLNGFIMKINFSGTHLWSKLYGGIKDDQFISMNRTHDGNF